MKHIIIVLCVLISISFSGAEAKADGSPSAPGHSAAATDVTAGGVVMANQDALRTPPITIELWARLANASSYNILVASDPKPSSQHWELYSHQTTGIFSVYLGGLRGNIDSDALICDNAWHYLAVTLDKDQVGLYVDGKLVKQASVPPAQGDAQPGEIAVGQLVSGSYDVLGCSGLIQDVRISSGVREIKDVPSAPFKKDATTIVLWPLNK